MPLHLIVFAGFYAAGRHAVRYADTLAQALRGRLVLLHVERAALFDPRELVGDSYHDEEMARQTDTAAALHQLAQGLHVHPLVEVATDLLPAVAQDLAVRYAPALFVLSPPSPDSVSAAAVATECAGLLRAGNYPLLVVPAAAPADQPPHRFLIAADAEAFELTAAAQPWSQLLRLPGAHVVVAHVSSGVEDDAGCGAALRVVQASGLVGSLPAPELRGYEHDDYAEGLLAAVQDTQADMVVVLARERSYLGELFHRSVTARLLEHCPVPVLVLPVVPVLPEAVPAEQSVVSAATAQWAAGVLGGLSPAN